MYTYINLLATKIESSFSCFAKQINQSTLRIVYFLT